MDKEKINKLLTTLEETEEELYRELRKEKNKISCDFFEEKIALWDYIKKGRPLVIISAPIIYAMIIPAVIMDIFVTIYQAICFPIYKIPKVKRSEYIRIDRHHLPYLNALQKLNCAYCGYFNGLIDYVREISSRTEQYWCPIQHSTKVKGVTLRYWHFLQYGDGKDLQKKWKELREELLKERN